MELMRKIISVLAPNLDAVYHKKARDDFKEATTSFGQTLNSVVGMLLLKEYNKR